MCSKYWLTAWKVLPIDSVSGYWLAWYDLIVYGSVKFQWIQEFTGTFWMFKKNYEFYVRLSAGFRRSVDWWSATMTRKKTVMMMKAWWQKLRDTPNKYCTMLQTWRDSSRQRKNPSKYCWHSWRFSKQVLHYVTDMERFQPPKKKPSSNRQRRNPSKH